MVALYLRWIFFLCYVYSIYPFLQMCKSLSFFLNILVIYFCILTYCTLELKAVNLRICTIMSHTVVVFYIQDTTQAAHVYLLYY